jgi:hypothetical protein
MRLWSLLRRASPLGPAAGAVLRDRAATAEATRETPGVGRFPGRVDEPVAAAVTTYRVGGSGRARPDPG